MHIDEPKLRREVGRRRKQLKRSEDAEIPERTWSYLDNMGFVLDATEMPDEEAISYMVSRIDELDAAAPSSYGSRSRERDDGDGEDVQGSGERGRYFEIELGAYERERQRAFAEVMARYVEDNEDPRGNKEIVNFRRDFLGEFPLTDEQVYALIESPAARYVHREFFERWGIPVIGHTAGIEGRYEVISDSPVDHRVCVHASPPGVTKRLRYSRPPAGGGPEDEDAADERMCVYTDSEQSKVRSPSEKPLNYRGKDGLKEQIHVWPGSLLDQIRGFASKWAGIYSWKEEDMLWVLLTGQAPKLSALTVNVRNDIGNQTTITLRVSPWVSAEVVRDNYQNIQRQILVGENRAPRLRSIAVLRFVERRIREEGKRLPWPELLKQWNTENPQWSYRSYRGLRQAYYTTLDKVVHAPFRRLQPKPLPAVERREREAKESALRMLEKARGRQRADGE